MTGTIKRVIEDRGFGFITDQGGQDLFFHCKDLPREAEFNARLIERRCTFDVQKGEKGPRAVNIRLLPT